ncbi:MAG: urease accessory protein UreH [Acidobacteria bacterium]|nr:urease accessory protein UreH [Acidobacteriota bacterium]MBK8148582.1 urease accessory protein UreH [Acidobacteriota bacterium]MBK8809662.1 urease accessory protein UreH [Acidobacteriota bacterium]
MNEILAAISIGSTAGVLGLGFFIGLKHATEGDHLAAVATIVSDRKSVWSSALVGGLWGLGHTISLVIAGVLVLLLNFEISERTERILEFGVGFMLLFLGLNVVRKLVKGGKVHIHKHEHGQHEHVHPHIHLPERGEEPETHHGLTFSPRSVLIGMVHGLAGSAALMLIVIPTIESKALGLLYIVVFGIGSIGGMMLMSFLVGLPFHFTATRFNRMNALLQGTAGIISIILGLAIIYEKGFTEGLFA